LYFINIQESLKNVGNTIGNICSSNISIHYHMVDSTPKEK
jgi:hypothetical protein